MRTHPSPRKNSDGNALRATPERHPLTCVGFSLYGSSDERMPTRSTQMAALGGKVRVTGSASRGRHRVR